MKCHIKFLKSIMMLPMNLYIYPFNGIPFVKCTYVYRDDWCVVFYQPKPFSQHSALLQSSSGFPGV